MGWIRCVGSEKLQRDFVAQTFALIGPVQYVLQQVSWSYETIPNAPKHSETHQNMSLGSNGVDQVHSLQKIQCDFMSRTFVLIEPVQYVSKQVSCCYGTIPNAPKYYETDPNFMVQWGGLDALVGKNPDVTSWRELLHSLHQFTPICTEFHAVTKRSQMGPKHYETHQNMSLGSNGVD